MTQTVTTEKELLDALEYPDNKVVALVGDWGIGKTHLWDELRRRESVRLVKVKPNYAYVSLFGMKDAAEIRSAIFAQFVSIDAQDASKGSYFKNRLVPYVDSLRVKVAKLEGLWKMGAEGFGSLLEIVKIYGVRDTLICLDDFERVASTLEASQLLGIVNDLIDQRECKLLLILNDNKLSEKNKQQLDEYRERTIDKEIRYEPDYQHVLSIAIPDEKLRALVEPHVKQLGTTNIRIIRRMRATIDEISKKTGRPIDHTCPGAISAICLQTYCHLMQGTKGVPSVEEVSKVELVSRVTDEEGVANVALAFLSSQNWVGVDECDRLIGDLVSRGIVDWDALSAEIENHRTGVAREAKVQEWREMWHKWHKQFFDQAASAAFVARIVETTKRNIEIVDAREIDDITDLMKKLNEPALAVELLDVWKAHNIQNPSAHLLRQAERFGKLKDPNFRDYLDSHAAGTASPRKDVAEILASMHSKRSWGGDDYRYLVEAPPTEYAQSFRQYGEVDLALLGWADLANSDPRTAESRAILESGKAALEILATESPTNAILVQSALRRVRMDDIPPPPQQEGG